METSSSIAVYGKIGYLFGTAVQLSALDIKQPSGAPKNSQFSTIWMPKRRWPTPFTKTIKGHMFRLCKDRARSVFRLTHALNRRAFMKRRRSCALFRPQPVTLSNNVYSVQLSSGSISLLARMKPGRTLLCWPFFPAPSLNCRTFCQENAKWGHQAIPGTQLSRPATLILQIKFLLMPLTGGDRKSDWNTNTLWRADEECYRISFFATLARETRVLSKYCPQ